jgi:hypothetical protein
MQPDLVNSRRQPSPSGQVFVALVEQGPNAQNEVFDRVFRHGFVRLAVGLGHGRLRGTSSSANPYRGFRLPAESISHAVWLYHRFSLSLRDVELILAARGVTVSYESIRDWGIRFGRQVAKTSSGGARSPATNGIWMKC